MLQETGKTEDRARARTRARTTGSLFAPKLSARYPSFRARVRARARARFGFPSSVFPDSCLLTPEAQRLLPQQPAGFFAEPGEHAGFGDVDRVGCGARFGCDFFGRQSVQHEPAEQVPAFLFEIGLDPVEESPGDVQVVFAIPRDGQIVGGVFESGEVAAEVGAAGRGRVHLAGFPRRAGAVDRNGPQPAAKRARLFRMHELREPPHHNCHDLLNQIVGVSAVDVETLRPVANERSVQFDKPVPGVRITRIAEPFQQCGRCNCHRLPLTTSVTYPKRLWESSSPDYNWMLNAMIRRCRD